MRIINTNWIDFLIEKDKKEKEKEYQRPFVPPQAPMPPPKEKKPKDREKKDDDGVIIIDI